MSTENDPKVYSNVPISIPVHIPEAEDYRMGGFAYSNELGIILSYRRDDDPSLDPLVQLRTGFSKSNSTKLRKPDQPISSDYDI